MTAKQKANELVVKYSVWTSRANTPKYMHYDAKQCALICVNELIAEQTMWQNGQTDPVLYWQEVKQEIEKL